MYSASHPEGVVIKFGEDLIIAGENLFALEDGKRIVIPWKETVDHFIELNMDKFDQSKNPSLAVMLGIRSRGGLGQHLTKVIWAAAL